LVLAALLEATEIIRFSVLLPQPAVAAAAEPREKPLLMAQAADLAAVEMLDIIILTEHLLITSEVVAQAHLAKEIPAQMGLFILMQAAAAALGKPEIATALVMAETD
jgi:hypothetical protein